MRALSCSCPWSGILDVEYSSYRPVPKAVTACKPETKSAVVVPDLVIHTQLARHFWQVSNSEQEKPRVSTLGAIRHLSLRASCMEVLVGPDLANLRKVYRINCVDLQRSSRQYRDDTLPSIYLLKQVFRLLF